MPISKKYLAEFNVGKYYHIYNRTSNREVLFKTDFDRYFFLMKYRDYLSIYVKTFSFVLMDNHFHFLVKVKAKEKIKCEVNKIDSSKRTKSQIDFLTNCESSSYLDKMLSMQFSKLFISYAKDVNRSYGRKGHLFCRPFKRNLVSNNSYLRYLIFYIHCNPLQKFNLRNFSEYSWSSYNSDDLFVTSIVDKKMITELFGTKEKYENFHSDLLDIKLNYPGLLDKF